MSTPPPKPGDTLPLARMAGDTWAPDAGEGEDTLASGDAPRVRTIDRYIIEAELGRGGMGVVYDAFDPQLHRRVAVKVLVGAAHASTEGRERFLREARAIAGMDHPSVVRIYDIGQHDGVLYFAMELLPGGSLRERLRGAEGLSLGAAVELVAAVAEGLDAAHSRGLVHRDVKPANILLDEEDQPRITDFGIVATASEDARLTRVGEVIGTPAYMSPEQARGESQAISPATDVYSLGVILAEATLGRHPMKGLDSATMLERLREGRGADLRALERALPGELFQVVARALAPEPRDRYADAGGLAGDLRRFQRGEPVLAAAPGPVTRLRWALRRNRRGVLVAAVSVLLLGAGTWAGTELVALQRVREARQLEQEALARVAEVQGRLQALEAAGAAAEADERFAELVEEDGIAGTRAEVVAWMGHATRQGVRGEGAAALESLARAWAGADRPEERGAILSAMASRFEARADLSALAAVVETMTREELLPSAGPARSRLRAMADLHRQDLARAAAGLARVPAEVALARPLGLLSDRRVLTADLGPGTTHGWLPGPAGGSLLVAAAGQPGVAAVPLAGGPPVPVEAAAGITLDGDVSAGPVAPDGVVGLQLADGRPSLGRLSGGVLRAAAVAGLPDDARLVGPMDIDGDHVDDAVFAGGHTLWRVEAGAEGLVARDALPGLARVGATVTGAWRNDLDGDGQEELVVGTGAWRGQDVRVYEWEEAGWRLAARKRLGEVASLTALPTASSPRVAALVQPRSTVGVPVPDDAPPFTGVVLLEYGRGVLDAELRIPLPARSWERVVAADVDGDGAAELLAVAVEGTMLLTGPLTEQPRRAWLPDLRVLAPLQLDDDLASELLTIDDASGAAVVLGTGTRATPRVVALAQPEPPPDDVEDPGVAEAWRRAEQLVALGLPGPAADSLIALSRQEGVGRAGVLAGRRAAALLEDGERRTEVAGALRESAGQIVPGDPVALDVAAGLRALLDLRGEQAVLGRYLEGAAADGPGYAEARARWDALQVHHKAVPLVVDPAAPLDPTWTVEAPDLVRRRSQAGVLALRPVGEEELARLPVSLDGRPVELWLDVELERGELGAGLGLALRPRGGGPELPLATVGVAGSTGSLKLQVAGFPGQLVPVVGGPGGAAPLQWRGRVGVTLDPELRRRRLELAAGDQDTTRVDPFPADLALPPGDYELVLRGEGAGCSLSRVLLHELTLVGGIETREVGPEPLRDAARMLAENRPEAALELLDGAAGAEGIAVTRLRYLAHDQLGQERAAHTTLRRLLSASAVDPARLLQASPERSAPRLADLRGRRWVLDAARAWSCAVAHHPEDPEVTQVLTWNLRDLDLVEADRFSDPGERLALAGILRARGRAWSVRSERPRARATLRHALEVLDGVERGRSEAVGADVRHARAEVLVEMAVLTLADQGIAATLPLVYRALRTSPTPEVLGDQLVLDHRLDLLWADESGAGLVAAARTGALPPSR